MDELTLLRRLDADAPAPTREAMTSAFDALTDRMAAAERHVPTRHRSRGKRLRRVALATTAALALAAGLVVTDTIGLAGLRPGASAQAAELLDRAADTAITTTDPVVHPGQYLVVRTVEVAMASDGWGGDTLHWQTRSVDTTYIPYDRHDEWVLERTPREPVAFFSTVARARALRQWAETRRAYDGRDELIRGRDGDFYGTPADEPGFADLPRDPRVLLNRIYRTTFGQGQSPDGEALEWITAQLRTGIVPADLRAALYRAAALIPGVTVTDQGAVLDGRKGVAIGRVEPSSGALQEIVIDPGTGLLIGERRVATRAVDRIPAGTVTGSTAVTTTVTDGAPTGPEHRMQ